MSETKHTPGPWIVGIQNHHDAWIHAPALKKTIAYIHNACGYTNPIKEDDANARLVAAAPELLESLKETIRILKALTYTAGIGKNQTERIERAEKVIAKAEGRP